MSSAGVFRKWLIWFESSSIIAIDPWISSFRTLLFNLYRLNFDKCLSSLTTATEGAKRTCVLSAPENQLCPQKPCVNLLCNGKTWEKNHYFFHFHFQVVSIKFQSKVHWMIIQTKAQQTTTLVCVCVCVLMLFALNWMFGLHYVSKSSLWGHTGEISCGYVEVVATYQFQRCWERESQKGWRRVGVCRFRRFTLVWVLFNRPLSLSAVHTFTIITRFK